MNRRRLCHIGAIVALFAAGVTGAAWAQSGATGRQADEKPGQGFDQAIITADEISYNDAQATVIARGNVEVVQSGRILLADSVDYNQREDSVVATGNVVILEPGGEIVFADRVELSDEMREGVIENIRIQFANDSRFAANGARRIGGTKTVMRRAVYSPCRICQDNPDRAPLWQLKATTIVHDQEAKDVTYTNAWLEFYGIPIAYTPYFSHPDPTVERQSGLLAPRFGTSSVFGAYSRTPVFWAVTDSIDITVEPIVLTKERPVLALEYRQQFNNGLLESSGSVTRADRLVGDPTAPTTETDKTRGHFYSVGRFDINDDWRWGFDYRLASDRTYLDRYNFFGDPGDTLENTLFVEGFHGRSYSAAKLFGYQDLRLTDPVDEPLILPMIDHNYMGEADGIGGRWSLDTNFRSTVRKDDWNTRRLSLNGGYLLPMIADFGLVTTVSASLRADAYHLDGVTVIGQTQNNVLETRIVPRLAVESRYPFVRGTDGTQIVVEPVVSIFAAPNTKNPSAIPDEDSVVIELDDTNVLSADRIPGLDKVETGQRVVYGLRVGLYGRNGGRITTFLGQSYRLPDDGPLAATTDIEQGRSDYVGRLEIVPSKYLDLLYRFRAARKDAKLLRSELSIGLGPPAFRLEGEYIFIASEASAGLFPDREEVTASFTSQLTDFWSLGLFSQIDLTQNGGTIKHGAKMTYEDECFRLEFGFRRDFTRTLDIEDQSVFFVDFVFSNLGNVTKSRN